MDFFRGWKTPLERYVPLSLRAPGTQPTEGDDDEDEDFDEGDG